MQFYFENLSVKVLLLYLFVSAVISALVLLLVKVVVQYGFKKELNWFRFFKILTALLFLIFLYLILTDKPYSGLR